MKFVELYKVQLDESQHIVVTCKLLNETVVCEGDQIIIEKLTNEGIPSCMSNNDERIFPKDGVRFLECLKFTLKSGYLAASDIMDNDIPNVT